MSKETDVDLAVPDDAAQFIAEGRCEDGSHRVGTGLHSCCCPARPVIEVLLPVGDTGRRVDLLLCAHHYRVSRPKLARLEATVTYLGEGWS